MKIINEIEKRIKNLRKIIKEKGVNGFLIIKPKNILYLTGKETGISLITENSAELWVKDLYREIYSNFYEHQNYPLRVKSLEKNAIKEYVKRKKFKNLLVESDLKIENLKNLKKELKKVRLIPTDLMKKIRMVKSVYEISQLKKSAEIAKIGMKKAYEIIKEDIKEIDAATEIEAEIRKFGSEEPPFGSGMLLSSGINSANIHAIPKRKKIRNNSLVVVDLGAKFNGYYSDFTRTIKVGKFKDKKEKDIFEFVKNLEFEVIDMIEEGMKFTTLYEFAENEIKKKGYKFYHSLGHGIGLEIHELPNISSTEKEVIREGMVFTIEPGIYIPKKFGVRFEDMVLVKNNKVQVLTKI